jgi:hypothetical protein
MIQENIKPIIIGLSFIIGVIIYTEQTKYVLINNTTNGSVRYLLLNKKTGEVGRYWYNFDTNTTDIVRIKKSGETTLSETKSEDLRK